MTAPTAPFRVVRGIAVALVGVLVAAAAHGAASGGRPPVAPLGAAVLLLLTCACVVLSARAWTPGRLVLALVAIQVGVHGALALSAGSGPVDPRLAPLAAAGSAHAHGDALATSPAMLLGHGLAVAVAALMLARVDSVALLLWQLARRILAASAAIAPARFPTAVVLLDGVQHRPTGPAPRRTATRRGPPARPALA